MSTQTATTPQTTNAAAPTPKAPRSQSVSLRGPDGAILRVTAIYRRDGTAVTYVVVTTIDAKKKRTNTRGASETHATVAAAQAGIEKLVKLAMAKGWQRKERASGFRAAPDAFTVGNLPAAKASKK
jgi:hypothetical protein